MKRRQRLFWLAATVVYVALAPLAALAAEQPAPAAWQAVEGQAENYKNLPAAEQLVEGTVQVESLRPTEPNKQDPHDLQIAAERFVLVGKDTKTVLVGSRLKLARFIGKTVEIKCKALNAELKEASGVRVGWIRQVATTAQADAAQAKAAEWLDLGGGTPLYKKIPQPEVIRRGTLTAKKVTVESNEVPPKKIEATEYYVSDGESSVLLSGQLAKLAPFVDKEVEVRGKMIPRQDKVEKMTVGWIREIKAAEPAGPAVEGKQGVVGRVTEMTGDFMPGPGPARGATTPLSVPVHVFKGKVKVMAKPDPKNPAFVATVQADKDGRFKVALPPGEYTVVAEIDGKLYLNCYEGTGHWATVTVKNGAWADWNIADSSAAAF